MAAPAAAASQLIRHRPPCSQTNICGRAKLSRPLVEFEGTGLSDEIAQFAKAVGPRVEVGREVTTSKSPHTQAEGPQSVISQSRLLMLSLLNWNLEWKRLKSRPGREIMRMIENADPAIACLTEAYDDSLCTPFWNSIHPVGDSGYPTEAGRRKVMLGSKRPWTETVTELANAPAGRFVSGLTESVLGPIRVHAVCVPWSHSHVSTGRRDRKAWEDHLSFLSALIACDGLVDPVHPTILTGDFNQTYPPKRAPEEARRLLLTLLEIFQLAPPGKVENRSVCHTLFSPALHVIDGLELPASVNGLRLSDHHGHVHRFSMEIAAASDSANGAASIDLGMNNHARS